ncbi:MAG: hypothetical protein C0412_02475 [Flavobacterium sp.]|nr:hypothetical protein [Flavobacterium sp.]
MGQETKTRLSIKTNSEHSFIYVDNKMQGRGGLEIELLKGNYKITVKESVLNWSGFELTDSIKISGAEKKMEKFYSLQKQVLINSEPENARVLAKDSLIGYTPLFIPSNIPNVTILKDRYASRNIGLNNSSISVIDLGLPIENNSGGFVKTVWFKVLVGTAAVLGAAAAYYKIQADKEYDDYLGNKSSSVLSEVNRLDSISGVALGAFQINFGVLIYFLLFD